MSSDWKSPFDDDGHTFHDGPLARFFRMRKWFFAIGVALLLIDTGWWDFEATTRTLALQALPIEFVQTALTLTGIYLLVQSALVTLQIGLTYSETVAARARIIKSEAVTTMREAATAREVSLGSLGPDANRIAKDFAHSFHGRDLDSMTEEQIHHLGVSFKQLVNEVERVAANAPSDPLKPDNTFRHASSDAGIPEGSRGAYEAAGYAFEIAAMRARANEMQRKGAAFFLITSEIALDGMRIVPTLGFLIYGLTTHGDLSGLRWFG